MNVSESRRSTWSDATDNRGGLAEVFGQLEKMAKFTSSQLNETFRPGRGISVFVCECTRRRSRDR